jgi:plasmid stability protein
MARILGATWRDGSGSNPLDMWLTCIYRLHMPKMIQLRHVPDGLHRRLKARAALEGMSLSDYLVREVRKVAERPTGEEIRARLERQAPVRLKTSPTRVLRQERDRHQAQQ